MVLHREENERLRRALSELHHYCANNRFLAGFIKAEHLIQQAADALHFNTSVKEGGEV